MNNALDWAIEEARKEYTLAVYLDDNEVYCGDELTEEQVEHEIALGTESEYYWRYEDCLKLIARTLLELYQY